MGEKDYELNEGQAEGAEARPADPQQEGAPMTQDENADMGDAEALALAAAQGLQDEVDRLNDQTLRLAAELENTRRRAEKEKVDAGKYAIANFARDLLSVADNFERATAAAPEDPSDLTKEGLDGLVTGVKMTEKELLTVLERHGVRRINPSGEKFDPNLHQAVAQSPTPGVPAGHVAQTAQTGFILGDRVLRAAMVIVSTGEGANPPAEADAPTENPAPSSIDTRV